MIFDAEDFSLFESCPRLPGLRRVFSPPRWPLRDAVKQAFKSGIRGLMAGDSPEGAVQQFIQEAAVPGFIYPREGEPFILAKDHESWLDGALRIVQEEDGQLSPLPVYQIENHHLHIEAWQGEDLSVHLFRVKSNLGERALLWPELSLMALAGEQLELVKKDIHIHVYRLPSVRNGRLLSPLNMAYQHPSFQNIQYRLARLYDEDEFNKNWKKLGRWEIQPNPEWKEWRLGMDRDKCLPLIRESYAICPKLDSADRKSLLYDIQQMCSAQDRPAMFPRYREKCEMCVFKGLCHGSEESRAEYQIAGQEALEDYRRKLAARMS